MTGQELSIPIETVNIPQCRESYGILDGLGESIKTEGLHRPICVWKNGTLISGARRYRAQFLMAGVPGGAKYRKIPAVFVDTIEDAAKHLLADNADETQAVAMKPSEICRLWSVLRQLDGPAALLRYDAAKRRGVESRRHSMATGTKKPKQRVYGAEYVQAVISEPFGLSEVSGTRLWTVYRMATDSSVADAKRQQAADLLAALDRGETSIWSAYSTLVSKRPPTAARTPLSTASAPAARQMAAWDRALPQLDGLVAGLSELGPPNSDLTSEQIAPVRARLAAARRDLEKIIRSMKENDK